MLRKSVTLRAVALTAGLLGSAEFAKGQDAEPAPPSSNAANLPPLEVTTKKAKKKSVAKAKPAAKAPPPAVAAQAPAETVEQQDSAAFPATGVSGPSTPGAQQINVT